MTKTYISESIKDGVLRRWLDYFMPLTVYIAPFRFYSKREEDYKYRDMVIKALNLWEKASSGKVRFNIVDNLNLSQINLDWKRVDRKAFGHCYFNFDAQNRLYSAEIQIGISDGVLHQKYQEEDEVYHTIVHEIGHAIGLGHSPNKEDIMYTPHQYGVVNLSKNDKLSLKWLYRFEQGKSVSQICSKYGFMTNDIDELVSHLVDKNNSSEFEKVKAEIANRPKKCLLQEQENIADLKKYNLALQDIKIPEKVRKYFIENKD